MKVNKIVIFIFFIVGNVLVAQQNQSIKIQLKWIQSTEVEIGKSYSVNAVLVECNFFEDNLNPSFSEIWDVQNGAVL